MSKQKKTAVKVEVHTVPAPKELSFDSVEGAKEFASGRTKGPKRVFKVAVGEAVKWVVARNSERALGVAARVLGASCEEVKAPRAKKEVDVLELLKSMPEDARNALLAQMKQGE